MADDKSKKPPKRSIGDIAYSLLKGVAGEVPGGTIATEILGLIVAPPIERRRDEWNKTIGERMEKLEQEGRIDYEKLQQDEGFASTVMAATQAALRTHHEEKIDALRNAVLNSALPQRPDDIRRDLFVRFIDDLTVLHLRIQKLMVNPREWFQSQGRPAPEGNPYQNIPLMVIQAFTDLDREKRLVEIVLDDLQRIGLLEKFDAGMIRLGDSLTSRGSDLGKEFLKFISDPPEA